MAMSFDFEFYTSSGIEVEVEVEYEPGEEPCFLESALCAGSPESISVVLPRGIDWDDLVIADAWVDGYSLTLDEIGRLAHMMEVSCLEIADEKCRRAMKDAEEDAAVSRYENRRDDFE